MFQLPIGPPAPSAECPHSPYTDFVAGIGCQDGEPQTTCNPSTVGISTATPTDYTCIASIRSSIGGEVAETFRCECISMPGADFTVNPFPSNTTCTFPSTPPT